MSTHTPAPGYASPRAAANPGPSLTACWPTAIVGAGERAGSIVWLCLPLHSARRPLSRLAGDATISACSEGIDTANGEQLGNFPRLTATSG